MCGLTPKGGAAEAWIVAFRVVQGAGGALMFPAALAIVVRTFPLRERGKALAIFFGIAGGLTAIGPILGGYLTQWTWRAIFWVNIPVAVIALVLTFMAKPENEPVPARIDYRGAVLVAVGIGLSIFGLQQSALWGWGNGGTWACIIGGLLVIVVFVRVEMRTPSPLMDVDDLSHTGLLRGEPGALDRHDGLHPGVLLRQRVRPDLAAQDGVGVRALPALLLHRIRHRRPDRRAHPRP